MNHQSKWEEELEENECMGRNCYHETSEKHFIVGKSFIASAVEAAREEGRREERREILAATEALLEEAKTVSQFMRPSKWNDALWEVQKVITSRESCEGEMPKPPHGVGLTHAHAPEGGKCCEKCRTVRQLPSLSNLVECANPDCECHSKKAV
jgi:hypothetical protein